MNHLNSACCNKMDFERKCRVVGIKIRHTISNCLLFLLHINLLEFIRACKLFRNTHVFTMYYKPKKQPWQKNKHGLRIVVFQENTHLPHEIWIKRNRQQQSNDDDKKKHDMHDDDDARQDVHYDNAEKPRRRKTRNNNNVKERNVASYL